MSDCNELISHLTDASVTSFWPQVESDAEFLAAVGRNDLLGYLYNTEGIARYVNYNAAPFWSFFHWLPPDYDAEDPVVHSNEWRVQGQRANPADYWKPLRQQYLTHPALPSGEKRKTRTDLVTAPLGESPFDAFGLTWWGVSRFQVQNVIPPASKALDNTSGALWSFTDCTGTLNAGDITLTPDAGETLLVAEVDLGSFDVAPYLYPHLCDRLQVGWDAANIESVEVFLVSVQGSKKRLTEAAGTFARPATQDAHYAGSWGQDFGQGIADDTGEDLRPEGISAATLTDAERVTAFLLLGGWTAATLRFEVKVADSGEDATLHYPELFAPATDGGVLQETGQTAALLFANGPGLREGQWNWWDADAEVLLTTPEVRPMGEKETVLDALCRKRVLLEGKERADGLDVEIAALYDATEGQSRADVAVDTIAVLLPGGRTGRQILINTLAEVPPMPGFPRVARDADLAALSYEAGNFAQEAFDLAQETRWLISPQEAAHLDNPGPPVERWTSLYVAPVAGWRLTGHRHAVTNNETPLFRVCVASVELAEVTPWHGYTLVAVVAGDTAPPIINPFNLEDDWGRYHRVGVSATEGNVYYFRSDFSVPLPAWAIAALQVTDSGEDARPVLWMDSRKRLYLGFQRGEADVYAIWSDDEGATWGEPTLMLAGARKPFPLVDEAGDEMLAGVVPQEDTFVIRGVFRAVGDLAFSAPFTFQDENEEDILVEDDTFGLAAAKDGTARWLLTCVVAGEDAASDWYSTDEKHQTWKRIT